MRMYPRDRGWEGVTGCTLPRTRTSGGLLWTW